MWKLSLKGASFPYQTLAVVVLFADYVCPALPPSLPPPCNNMENISTVYPGTGLSSVRPSQNPTKTWLDQGDDRASFLNKGKHCQWCYLINSKFSEKALTIIKILSTRSTYPDGWISLRWFIILTQKIRRSSQLTAQHSNVNQIFQPSDLAGAGWHHWGVYWKKWYRLVGGRGGLEINFNSFFFCVLNGLIWLTMHYIFVVFFFPDPRRYVFLFWVLLPNSSLKISFNFSPSLPWS